MFSFSINLSKFYYSYIVASFFLNLFLEFHREWNFKEFPMFNSNILIAINHFNFFKDYFFFFFKPGQGTKMIEEI